MADYKKFKGPRPTHILIDEILPLLDEDSPVNIFRKEFYSDQMPTGYVPPYPLNPAERVLKNLNKPPEEWEEYFGRELPVPSLREEAERWRDDLQRHRFMDFHKDLHWEPKPPGGDVA